MSHPLPPPAATATTLVNKLKHQVKYNNGLEEMIDVKELEITDLYTFLEHMAAGKAPALVGLCTGKGRPWVDSLEPRSFVSLAQKCIKINFQRAMIIAEETVAGMTATPLLVRLGQTLGLTASLLPRETTNPPLTPISPAESSPAGATGAEASPAPASSGSAAATGTPASG